MMARQARDTSMIMDCGKPMIIRARACALSRHARISLLPGALNQRMLLELIVHMPADRMPLVAPTAVWAMHVAKPRVLDPGRCLDACLALRCALEVYGIAAHPAAVQVGIGPVGEN